MSGLHHVAVADGSLLQLALGLEVMISRFDAIVDEHAPAASVAEVLPTETHERTVELVLGLVALRNRIAAELTAASTPIAPAPPVGSIDESWLR